MSHPDDALRKAIALFRYGLITDVLPVPPGSQDIRRRLREKAQRTYTIPGTRRTRVAVETMRDWLSLYRTGGFEALYPKTRADRGQRRNPTSNPRVGHRSMSDYAALIRLTELGAQEPGVARDVGLRFANPTNLLPCRWSR